MTRTKENIAKGPGLRRSVPRRPEQRRPELRRPEPRRPEPRRIETRRFKVRSSTEIAIFKTHFIAQMYNRTR